MFSIVGFVSQVKDIIFRRKQGIDSSEVTMSSAWPSTVKTPVCLIVIDGWGISENKEGNAILNAEKPVMDRLAKENGLEIEAHGLHVGLPQGLMGNSEVGHLNIGCGRVIYQDIVRINIAVETGDINDNEALVAAFNNAKSKNGRLHFLGLVSNGGVHSHIDHLFGMVKAAKHNQVPQCFVHFFGDGRDTSPNSGAGFCQQLLTFLNEQQYGQLSTVVGRYYAMDRDTRWERIQIAYDGLVGGVGEASTQESVVDVINTRYANGETDEFLKPIILGEEGRIKENDTMVFFNYRSDRMRQIAETFGLQRHFESAVPFPSGLKLFCMTQYKKEFPFPQLFGPSTYKNVLAEWLAEQKCSQFHCAETEKYAHVTFFFNGGIEKDFENEERCLVTSPKVATYDLQPAMSSAGVADKMVDMLNQKKHPFVMCNFAPPDMVGHTGVYEAARIAVQATDTAIGRVREACEKNGYVLFVTSDHGNAEQMYDPQGEKHTAHTCNRVPLYTTSQQKLKIPFADRAPGLRDVAPTCLAQMGLPIAKEMTGIPLF